MPIEIYKLTVIFHDGHKSCYPHVYDFINDKSIIRFKILADNFKLEYYIRKVEFKDFDLERSVIHK